MLKNRSFFCSLTTKSHQILNKLLRSMPIGGKLNVVLSILNQMVSNRSKIISKGHIKRSFCGYAAVVQGALIIQQKPNSIRNIKVKELNGDIKQLLAKLIIKFGLDALKRYNNPVKEPIRIELILMNLF
jgi:hypothetical protein